MSRARARAVAKVHLRSLSFLSFVLLICKLGAKTLVAFVSGPAVILVVALVLSKEYAKPFASPTHPTM